MGNDKRENSILDESMRRLGGILASPALVLSYGHTTPLLERSWLRRLGLTKEQTAEFMDLLCRHGLLDRGARAVVGQLCAQRRIQPAQAAAMLLAGEGWPEEDEDQQAGKEREP